MTTEQPGAAARPFGCLRAAGWTLAALLVLLLAGWVAVGMMIGRGLAPYRPHPMGPGADAVQQAADDTARRLGAADADGELADREIQDSAGTGDVLSVERGSTAVRVVVGFSRPRTAEPGGAGTPRPVLDCFDYTVTPGVDVKAVMTGACPRVTGTPTPGSSRSGG